MNQRNTWEYLKRVLLTVGIIGSFIVLLLLGWAIANILLMLFTGVLLAVGLRSLAKPIIRYTPLTNRWAIVIVVAVTILLLVLAGWLIVPEIANQFDQLFDQIVAAIAQIEQFLEQQGITDGFPQDLLDDLSAQLQQPEGVVTGITDTLTLTLGVLSNVLFIIFTGLFVAIDPDLYRNGLVSLVPPDGRPRAREIIGRVVLGLRHWLIGRIVSMIAVGIVVGVGLSILGVPLALVLGLIAGLLEFIPVVGPILAGIPATLVALIQDPILGLYALIFYVVVQQLEGNVLTPIVQQKMVSLPPALTLTAILAMGLLFGPIGVLLATPVAVVFFILVRQIYLRDILGTPVNE